MTTHFLDVFVPTIGQMLAEAVREKRALMIFLLIALLLVAVYVVNTYVIKKEGPSAPSEKKDTENEENSPYCAVEAETEEDDR